MISNIILLNSEKTEVLIIGPKTSACNNLDHCLTLDGCSVSSSVLFDSNLSFESHVSSIYKTAFLNLKIYLLYALNVKCRKFNSCVHDLKVRLL